MLSANGALHVNIAGDWVSEEHVALLRSALSNCQRFRGAQVIDLSEAGRISAEARLILDSARSQERPRRNPEVQQPDTVAL